MDHLTIYEEYNVDDYIGKPVARDIRFKDKNGETYLLTIFHNKTLCITYPSRRTYMRVSALDIEANKPELNQIDPTFESWLKTQLQSHYDL